MDVILLILILIVAVIVKKLFTPSINPYRFPKVRNWAKQGRYFNFEGYPIFYYDSVARDGQASSKPTLLLLHGYPTSSIDWLSMRDELEQRFHLIAPDYIGYGLSAKPVTFNYTISSQATMIEQLMTNSLKFERFHMMAHDVGVTVAQELLARQIDGRDYQIQSTVLLNGGLFPETHRPFVTMKMLKTPIVGVILQSLMSRAMFGRAFNRVFGPHTQRSAEELDEVTDLLFYNAPYNLLQQLQCYINERFKYRDRWVNALNEVQRRHSMPIRLINGPIDPISGKHMVERYRELIDNPDTCLLPAHIGHYPNMEDPVHTLEYFFEFHKKLSR